MNNVPSWIFRAIRNGNFKCGGCHNELNEGDLSFVGVAGVLKSSSQQYLSIGLSCKKCKNQVMFNITKMGLSDFAVEIIGNGVSGDSAENDNNKFKEFVSEGFGGFGDEEEEDYDDDSFLDDWVNNELKDDKDEIESWEDYFSSKGSFNKYNRRKKGTTKITDKEFNDFVKRMGKIKYHEDFLIDVLGYTYEQVREFDFKKENK